MKDAELLELKEKINRYTQKKANLQGKFETLMKRLSDEFNCKSITEAETLIGKNDAEVKEMQTDLDQRMKKVNEILDIIDG